MKTASKFAVPKMDCPSEERLIRYTTSQSDVAQNDQPTESAIRLSATGLTWLSRVSRSTALPCVSQRGHALMVARPA